MANTGNKSMAGMKNSQIFFDIFQQKVEFTKFPYVKVANDCYDSNENFFKLVKFIVQLLLSFLLLILFKHNK
jgi:hypothetical protein